ADRGPGAGGVRRERDRSGGGRRRAGRSARDGEAGTGGSAPARERQQVSGRLRARAEPDAVLHAHAALRALGGAEAGRRMQRIALVLACGVGPAPAWSAAEPTPT